jgi:hypothetical protein
MKMNLRVLIRCLIIGIILVNKNSNIKLGIDKKIKKLIEDFLKNLNNRRRIDNEYYIELLFIENFLQNSNSKITSLEKLDEEFYEKLVIDFKDRQIWMKEENLSDFEIEDEGLKINEFNLYWKKHLILGDYRQWRKRCTDAVWKNEILNSRKLDDLFIKNYKNEFDWIKSLRFISNKNKFSF